MRRRAIVLLAAASLFAPAARPYILHRSNSGAPARRPDSASVQMMLDQNFVPGFTNSDGTVVVTPDSDVNGALNAALATWNNVSSSAAQFAPIETTTSENGHDVIVMSDTPAIRSMLGSQLNALTLLFVSGSTILYSQIYFNPVSVFSSTGAPNTFDLQSAFTKQLGNALGVSNSAVFGSALFVFSSPNEVTKQNLSPDDLAGVTTLYPGPGASNYGLLTGTLTINGSPLRNALVSAVDPNAGTALTVLTNAADGTWSMATPPGSYEIYAQPLITDPNQFGQIIAPSVVGLSRADTIDTNFQPTFLGGDGSPATVTVSPGSQSDASFSPDPPNGNPQTSLLLVNAVAVGAPAPSNLALTPEPVFVTSGQASDILIRGIGIDATVNDANIQLLGPVFLRPGTTKQSGATLNFNDVDYPLVRFTVDVPAVTTQSYATLVVTNNGNFAAYTAGIVILPPPQ